MNQDQSLALPTRRTRFRQISAARGNGVASRKWSTNTSYSAASAREEVGIFHYPDREPRLGAECTAAAERIQGWALSRSPSRTGRGSGRAVAVSGQAGRAVSRRSELLTVSP